MKYKPLKTMNPGNEDVTINHSVWLCSRLMPAKGNELISFPHYRVINETGMRTAEYNDLKIPGLIAMNDNEKLINLQTSADQLEWKGLWTIDGQPVIGHCTNEEGLTAPFNTFNVGYRYKRGWRPSCVN